MSKLSQKDRVLCHLHKFGEITSWEAIKEYGITRISAVIFKLRKEGWYIENEWVTTKNRYGDDVRFVSYKLMTKPYWKIKKIGEVKEIGIDDIEWIKVEEVK